ncbi:MAG: 5'/3'-nucleotidase SurE, partial [Gemmatimonadales bacterium]|jgi:5'-nucleotidase
VITNDDGIDDDGINALAKAFASEAETFVVAPMENRSGSTNYVSAIATRSLTVERRDLGPGITAYAVDGYPADAVVFALAGLLAADPPDLVISGINNGPNLSDDAYLSGTVGAARMAAFAGIPAIAVSGHNNEPETLAAIARWVIDLAGTSLVRDLEPRQYLTVSVPQVSLTEIAGVEIVRRGPWPYSVALEPDDQLPADQPGREVWRLTFSLRPVTSPPGTDTYAFGQNRIAIVPMRVDEHDYGLLERLLASDTDLPAWPPPDERR